jgi:hypothetical protein
MNKSQQLNENDEVSNKINHSYNLIAKSEYNEKIADISIGIGNNNNILNSNNNSKILSNFTNNIQSKTYPINSIPSSNINNSYNPNKNINNQMINHKKESIEDYQVLLDKAINKLSVGSYSEKEKALSEIETTFSTKQITASTLKAKVGSDFATT